MKGLDMKEQTVSTVHWSKYLDESVNPRVKGFLKSRGDDVMWQVASNIKRAKKRGLERLVIMVHENAPYAIRIPQEEYHEVLDLSLKYFEKKEEYETCAKIVEFKNYTRENDSNLAKKETKKVI